MMKNIPILSFDQDQKIWSLDFTNQGKDPVSIKLKKRSEPDRLTRFLQNYGSTKKSSVAFLNEQIRNQIKFEARRKKFVNSDNKFQEDNLFLLLKDHMEKSKLQDSVTVKMNRNIRMNLHE